MTRSVPLCVALLAVLATRTHADTMFPNGATITFPKTYIHEDNNPSTTAEPKTPDSLLHYFNLAHCQCSIADGVDTTMFFETTFGLLLNVTGGDGSAIHLPLDIWVGSSCDQDATTRTTNCHKIDGAGVTDVSDQIQSMNGHIATIPLFDVFAPTPAQQTAKMCPQVPGNTTVYATSDANLDGTPDIFFTNPVTFDTQPPPVPTNWRAEGGESGINISWDVGTGNTSDIFAYQAFCARADDDSPGRTSNLPPQRYQTSQTLCGAPVPMDATVLSKVSIASDNGDVDGGTPGTVTPPQAMLDLDPSYLCGETLSPTATSLRLDGLENGVSYKVAIIAVDRYQNPIGVYFDAPLTPTPVTDFWEDVHDRGSKVHGGFCLLAETYGNDSFLTNALRSFRDDTLGDTGFGRWLTDAYYGTLAKLGAYVHGSTALRIVAMVVLLPLVAIALLWHVLTLPGLIGLVALIWIARRRRHWLRRIVRVAAPAMAVAIVCFAGRAHAGGYQPYWEDAKVGDENAADDDDHEVDWIAGIKVGPYVPQIDKHLGLNPGPYKQMFGGGLDIIPMFDLDRIVLSGDWGQLGFGGSIGYMGKKAKAWVQGSDPNDPMRPRSGDDNKFRLIPLAATATYRFTMLDDRWGIPVVPYIRGGLSYYIWYVLAPGGSFAKVCKTVDMPTCEVDKAVGASAGFQGAIGLAVRAERIDEGAAQSMQQSGIQHAGFYAEISAAKVDGFGNDEKLSVGDTTWFAGVDFEF